MKFKFNADKSKLILTEATQIEIHQLKLWFVRYAKDYRFMTKFKLGVWDGKIDNYTDGYFRFGLWHEIVKVCKQYDFKLKFPDKDDFPFDNKITYDDIDKFAKEYFDGYKQMDGTDFMPYDHQIDSVYRMLKYKFGAIEVATAGGKSLILGLFLFYYLKYINPNANLLLIVPSISLVTQFHDDIIDYNIGYHKEQKKPFNLRIQEFMSDKPRKLRAGEEPNVSIGTYQSLEKYPEQWFRQFDLVVCDEAHQSKAPSLEAILSRTFGAANYRLGMSGTYPDEESADFMTITSLLGPRLLTIGARKLMEQNIISEVKIKSIIINHNDPTFADNLSVIKRAGDGKRAYLLEKEYVQKSHKRKEFIRKLIGKLNQNSLLLFHTIEYGKDLFEYMSNNITDKDFYYIDGTTPGAKRNVIKKNMEIVTGRPQILIASFGTLSTGVNIKAICNIIFLDSFKSDKMIRQSIGRGLRLHALKQKLVVFDIVDMFSKSYKNALYRHYESRRETIYKKQDFPFDELKIVL
jgi:superfamily II DNA or RNA helicase